MPNITVGGNNSIFVKLNQYNYEFEIDSNLRLASIDGVKIADNNSTITTEQYESLLSEIKSMKENYDNLKEDYEKRISTLENETIVNKRVNLMNTVVSIPIKNSNVSVSDITLSDSLNNYKYLEFEYDCANGSDYFGNSLKFISTNSIIYNNSNTDNWKNNSINMLSMNFGDLYGSYVAFWFKNDKTVHITESYSNSGYSALRIKNIYGIK